MDGGSVGSGEMDGSGWIRSESVLSMRLIRKVFFVLIGQFWLTMQKRIVCSCYYAMLRSGLSRDSPTFCAFEKKLHTYCS